MKKRYIIILVCVVALLGTWVGRTWGQSDCPDVTLEVPECPDCVCECHGDLPEIIISKVHAGDGVVCRMEGVDWYCNALAVRPAVVPEQKVVIERISYKHRLGAGWQSAAANGSEGWLVDYSYTPDFMWTKRAWMPRGLGAGVARDFNDQSVTGSQRQHFSDADRTRWNVKAIWAF
jgi:hypothetical protein